MIIMYHNNSMSNIEEEYKKVAEANQKKEKEDSEFLVQYSAEQINMIVDPSINNHPNWHRMSINKKNAMRVQHIKAFEIKPQKK